MVSTASYEARKFGIHSAMPLRLAYRLCPQAIFLPVDYDAYARVSAQIKAILRTFSPVMEDVGIDEAYLDLTASGRPADEVAREIKQRVRGATGLTCSVGIAPNKLLAKIASDLHKPDGLTVIAAGDVKTRIWPLPVRKIPGVGPVTERHLHRLGIETIGQLAARPLEEFAAEFGPAHGAFLHQAAHWEPKSHSREITFQRDTGDWQTLAHTLAELAREVADGLREAGVKSRRVGIKLRFADFETHTREKTLGAATDSAEAIHKTAFACLQCIALNKKVRRLGVRVGELERDSAWPWYSSTNCSAASAGMRSSAGASSSSAITTASRTTSSGCRCAMSSSIPPITLPAGSPMRRESRTCCHFTASARSTRMGP